MELARQIAPHELWLGNTGVVRDLARVRRASIVAIVDLALDEPVLAPWREAVYGRFPLMDGAGNPRWLLRGAVEMVAGLVRAGAPTLVCCSAGMSRSPAVVAAALSRVSERAPAACLARVAATGPADVSPGLWRDLLAVCGGAASR